MSPHRFTARSSLPAGLITDRADTYHVCRLCDPQVCGHDDGRCPRHPRRRPDGLAWGTPPAIGVPQGTPALMPARSFADQQSTGVAATRWCRARSSSISGMIVLAD